MGTCGTGVCAYIAGVLEFPCFRSAALNPGRILRNAMKMKMKMMMMRMRMMMMMMMRMMTMMMMMMTMMMMMMMMMMSISIIVRKRRTIMLNGNAVILQPMTSWCSFHSLQHMR